MIFFVMVEGRWDDDLEGGQMNKSWSKVLHHAWLFCAILLSPLANTIKQKAAGLLFVFLSFDDFFLSLASCRTSYLSKAFMQLSPKRCTTVTKNTACNVYLKEWEYQENCYRNVVSFHSTPWPVCGDIILNAMQATVTRISDFIIPYVERVASRSLWL